MMSYPLSSGIMTVVADINRVSTDCDVVIRFPSLIRTVGSLSTDVYLMNV